MGADHRAMRPCGGIRKRLEPRLFSMEGGEGFCKEHRFFRGAGEYLLYFENDILPRIEQTLSFEVRDRGIAGYSMAGCLPYMPCIILTNSTGSVLCQVLFGLTAGRIMQCPILSRQ